MEEAESHRNDGEDEEEEVDETVWLDWSTMKVISRAVGI
jgi:hypothetical protein